MDKLCAHDAPASSAGKSGLVDRLKGVRETLDLAQKKLMVITGDMPKGCDGEVRQEPSGIVHHLQLLVDDINFAANRLNSDLEKLTKDLQ
jgi:uncharacterized protein YoxC